MLTKFLRGAALKPATSSGIQYVGGYVEAVAGTTASVVVSLTSLTGGLASSPAAGDFVLVAFGVGSNTTSNLPSIPTGYTNISTAGANDTFAAKIRVAYKFMPSTPDTTLTIPNGTFSNDDAGAVYISVWRNVNTTTPLDVSVTGIGLTNTVLPNPQQTNPSTIGNTTVAIGIGAHILGVQTFGSSDLTNFMTVGSNDARDVTIGGGYIQNAPAFDPAAFTFSSTNSVDFSSISRSVVLRPQNITKQFVASSLSPAGTVDTEITINTPNGTQAGDYLIAIISNGTRTMTTPAGWTLLASDTSFTTGRVYAFGRLLSDSPTSTYSFSFSGSTTPIGIMTTFRGFTSATGTTQATTGSVNITAPSVTATEQTYLVCGFAIEANATSLNIAPTLISIQNTLNDSSTRRLATAYQIVNSGATGTRLSSASTAGNNVGVSILLS